MKPKVTAADIAAKFQEKGLTPTWGTFNLTIKHGKFAAEYGTRCCPISAWVIGEPVAPDLDPDSVYNVAGRACQQFTKETGIDGQMFWRDYDAACQIGHGNDGFGAEVA